MKPSLGPLALETCLALKGPARSMRGLGL